MLLKENTSNKRNKIIFLVDVLEELTKPKSQEISKFQFNDGYGDRSSSSDEE